jgi:hypothetical protein
VSTATFDHVDLTSVKIKGGRIRPFRLDHVVFIDCDLDGIQIERAELSRCEFIRCNLGTRFLGRIESTLLRRCSFRACAIGNVAFRRADIQDCIFEDTRSQGTRFERCSIADTRMSGEFTNMVVLENDLTNVDLTTAILRGGVIAETRSAANVALPIGPASFVVSGEVLSRLRQRLAGLLDAESLDAYEPAGSSAGIQGRASERFIRALPGLAEAVGRPRAQGALEGEDGEPVAVRLAHLWCRGRGTAYVGRRPNG